MVFRLQGAAAQTSAIQKDGSTIARAGQVASAGIGAVVGVADQYLEREANLFVETSLADFKIGMDDDLRNIGADSLGGEGYAERATQAYNGRKAALYQSAGKDPYKTKQLDDFFGKVDAENISGFEDGQRGLAVDYGIASIGRHTDDAMQRAAQQSYGGATEVDNSTLGMIRGHEGFRQTAYWDVNAWRTGYGSDTVTRADGSIEKVTKNTRVTQEDADRDLSRRAAVFEQGVVKSVGADAWSGMDAGQRAALTSIAYNYGSLPKRVADVVKSGGDVVSAIRGLGSDNDGVNQRRRNEEANVFASGHTAGRDQNGVPVYDGELPDLLKSEGVAEGRDMVRAQIDALEGLGVTANKRDEMKRAVDNNLSIAALTKLGEENPSMALAMVRSGQMDGALTYKQSQSFQANFGKVLEQRFTEQAKEQERVATENARQKAADYTAWNENGRQGEMPEPLASNEMQYLTGAMAENYDFGIMSGDIVASAGSVDLANAADFLQSIAPGGEGYETEAKLYEVARDVIEGRAKGAMIKARVDASFGSGIPPDMSDPDVKNEMNARFDQMVGMADGDDIFAYAAQFVNDYGVAPKAFGVMVGQAMASDDPALQARAVEAVGQLHAADARALTDAGGKQIDRAIDVSTRMSLGVPFADAMKLSMAQLDPAGAPMRDARSAAWKADKAAMADDALEKLSDRIGARAKGAGDAGAALPETVAGEYLDIVRDQYLITGQMDVAVAVAERAFYATHGVTNVGGVSRWQRGAPEAFPQYQVYPDSEQNSAYIEDQATQFASYHLGHSVDGVVLQPIGDVSRDKAPSYQVFAPDPDGLMVEVGKPFTPQADLERALSSVETAFAPENSEAAQTARAETRKMRQLQTDYVQIQDARLQAIRSGTFDFTSDASQSGLAEMEAIQAQIKEAKGVRDVALKEVRAISRPDSAQSASDKAMRDAGFGAGPAGVNDLSFYSEYMGGN